MTASPSVLPYDQTVQTQPSAKGGPASAKTAPPNALPKKWRNTLVYGPYRGTYLVLHLMQALQLHTDLRVLASVVSAASWDDALEATDLRAVSSVLSGTSIIADAYSHTDLVAWHAPTCPLRACQEGSVSCTGEGCVEHQNCELDAHAAFEEAPPEFAHFRTLVRVSLPDLIGQILAWPGAEVYVQQGKYVDLETVTIPSAIMDLAQGATTDHGAVVPVWPESAIPQARKIARQEGYLFVPEPDLITRVSALVSYLHALQLASVLQHR